MTHANQSRFLVVNRRLWIGAERSKQAPCPASSAATPYALVLTIHHERWIRLARGKMAYRSMAQCLRGAGAIGSPRSKRRHVPRGVAATFLSSLDGASSSALVAQPVPGEVFAFTDGACGLRQPTRTRHCARHHVMPLPANRPAECRVIAPV